MSMNKNTNANAKYGYFSQRGHEYIVTRYDTPLPWVNYLTNGDYCAIVSSTGGGFSFYKSHLANMVLRREQRCLRTDMPGRYVYIRDNETNEYWTVNVMPCKKEHKGFKAAHGLGYTIIESETLGIKGEITFFVPQKFDCEIAMINIQNISNRKRDLSIFFYEELQLGNYYFHEQERAITSMFQDVHIEDGSIFGEYKLWSSSRDAEDNFKSTAPWQHEVYITATTAPSSIETSYERFVGVHRDVTEPAAIADADVHSRRSNPSDTSNPATLSDTSNPTTLSDTSNPATLPGSSNPATLPGSSGLPNLSNYSNLSNKDTSGAPAVAAMKWDVKLDYQDSFPVSVITGISDKGRGKACVKRIKGSSVNKLWRDTVSYWDSYVNNNIWVETPDRSFDRMVNYWNKYQVFINFSFGRGPSYYHLGQSMGMRDSFQDMFGMISISTDRAREQLLNVASFIFKDGSPPDVTSRIEYSAKKGDKVDVPLWMGLAAVSYIKETGDWGVLDEVIPYLDGGEGDLSEHIIKGIDRIVQDSGIHGLPLFGGGDWNDSLNRVGEKGKGESVWLAQFIYYIINELRPLLEYKKLYERIAIFEKIGEQLKSAHEKYCWDGGWYIIGFNDDHEALGTKDDRVGRVYLNTQTWAAISGIGDKNRLEAAMDSVDKYLENDYGLTLIWPAYDHLDENIGVISAFARGMKENGAVFSQATAFNLVGKALLGRGNDIYRIIKKMLPCDKDPDIYMVEPFVYSQFVMGAENVEYGRGGYHWMTGAAAWMFRLSIDYFLGIKSDYNGILISPCICREWKEYKVKKVFRGAVYNITVENPAAAQTGVKEIFVNGEKICGNLIPILPKDSINAIKVIM